MAADVTVLIPTFRRPEGLDRALASVAAQDGLAQIACEVVVVDNAAEGDAAPVAERWRERLAVPLVYVARAPPRRGDGTQRRASGSPPARTSPSSTTTRSRRPAGWRRWSARTGGWRRTSPSARSSAAPRTPQPELRPLLERFFSRADRGPTGLAPDAQGCGCGNSIMRRSTALAAPAPFDEAANETGGEDDRLFALLAAQGRPLRLVRGGLGRGVRHRRTAPPSPMR